MFVRKIDLIRYPGPEQGIPSTATPGRIVDVGTLRLGSIVLDGPAGAHIVDGGTRERPGDAKANHLVLSHLKVQVHARQEVSVLGAVGIGHFDEIPPAVLLGVAVLDACPRRTLVGVDDPHTEIAGDRHIEESGIHAELQEGHEQFLIHGIVIGQHIAVLVVHQVVDAAVEHGCGIVRRYRGETEWRLGNSGRLERRAQRPIGQAEERRIGIVDFLTALIVLHTEMNVAQAAHIQRALRGGAYLGDFIVNGPHVVVADLSTGDSAGHTPTQGGCQDHGARRGVVKHSRECGEPHIVHRERERIRRALSKWTGTGIGLNVCQVPPNDRLIQLELCRPDIVQREFRGPGSRVQRGIRSIVGIVDTQLHVLEDASNHPIALHCRIRTETVATKG